MIFVCIDLSCLHEPQTICVDDYNGNENLAEKDAVKVYVRNCYVLTKKRPEQIRATRLSNMNIYTKRGRLIKNEI